MADAKICDRCGAIIKYRNERWHAVLTRERVPYIFSPRVEELDMCEKCKFEFDQFIADGKKKETNDE